MIGVKRFKLLSLILIKLVGKKLQTIFFILFLFSLGLFLFVKFDLHELNKNYLSEGFIGTFKEDSLPDPVLKLLSSSLVSLDEKGKPKPELTNGWEVNSDSTIFKFKLKDNLKWVDGTSLKSTDLEFNIPDVEANYPDEKTVQFKLNSPYAPFPTLLSKPVFKKGYGLVGTGPYKIIRLEKSRIYITKIVMEPLGNKKLPALITRFYPSEKIAQTAFGLGEIQVLFGPNDLNHFDKYPNLKSEQSVNYSKLVSIFYNNSDKLLSTRSLRQALSFQSPEIKNEQLAETTLPPNSWAYTKPQKNYLANENEAKAALERAKSNLSSELLQSEIILTTIPSLENVGRMVINSWNDLGIKSSLRIESGVPQNFQALLITQSIPSDPDQYTLWHSTQTRTNLSNYNSKRADKDLEDARKTLNEEERKEKYSDFQKVLLEDAPATFLYFPKNNIIYLHKAESRFKKLQPLQIN